MRNVEIKEWLKVAVLVIGLTLGVNLWWNVRSLLQDLRGTTTNVRATSAEFQQYWAAQRKVVESDKNQKAIEAAIAVGATYQATGRLINTMIIPAAIKQLQAGTVATQKLSEVVDSGNRFVLHMDANVNDKLLPEIVAGVQGLNKLTSSIDLLAQGIGVSVDNVISALNQLVKTGDITVQMLNLRLADPKLDELITAAVAVAKHTEGIATNLGQTTAELPPIIKQARRWQKPLQLANLIAILASVFKPY